MKSGAITQVKAPIMIRIPMNTQIIENVVYLGKFVIGVITPLCPDGFVEISSYSIVTIESQKNTELFKVDIRKPEVKQ